MRFTSGGEGGGGEGGDGGGKGHASEGGGRGERAPGPAQVAGFTPRGLGRGGGGGAPVPGAGWGGSLGPGGGVPGPRSVGGGVDRFPSCRDLHAVVAKLRCELEVVVDLAVVHEEVPTAGHRLRACIGRIEDAKAPVSQAVFPRHEPRTRPVPDDRGLRPSARGDRGRRLKGWRRGGGSRTVLRSPVAPRYPSSSDCASASQFQRRRAASLQRRRRSLRDAVSRSRIERMARASAAGSVGSHTAPSGPSGSSRMIRRRSGKSDETTGRPAAIDSNNLFGVDNRSFSVSGWFGITPTSADATQGRRSAGETASRTWTRLPDAGSPARSRSRSRSGPKPMSTRWARSRPGSSIAWSSVSSPRVAARSPWYRTTGSAGGIPKASRMSVGRGSGVGHFGTQLWTTATDRGRRCSRA